MQCVPKPELGNESRNTAGTAGPTDEHYTSVNCSANASMLVRVCSSE